MARGKLRIFLGVAPVEGTSSSLLTEGRALLAAGVDVVVGAAAGADPERALAPEPALDPRAETGRELDVEALLARRPAVVLVDDLAWINPAGARHRHRWEDVEELLEAGIDVVSAVDVRRLASLAAVAESITGLPRQETVPDDVVRRADRVELVDPAPELLRGATGTGATATAGSFRPGAVDALRELALLWLAARNGGASESYPDPAAPTGERGRAGREPGGRERVVVGLGGGQEGELLIRRAARSIARTRGGELLAVHVRPFGSPAGELTPLLEAQRRLVAGVGGTYQSVGGDDPARALLDVARSSGATRVVVGASRRRPLGRWPGRQGVAARVLQEAGDVDVQLVPFPGAGTGTTASGRGSLGRRRVMTGFALAVLLPIAIALLTGSAGEPNFALTMLIQFTAAIAVALVGGLWPAVLAAVWGSVLLNYFSTAPVRTLIISDPANLVALVLFVAVSAAVAVVVDRSARRSKEAAAAGAEAATLSELARGVLAGQDTARDLLEQVRARFQMTSVALFHRSSAATSDDGAPLPPGEWTLQASVGEGSPPEPAGADNVEEVADNLMLALNGRTLPARDRRLLGAFGAHLVALEQRHQLSLTRQANLRLAEGDKMRTAVLRAVSHDLRTPLAGIKLAVSSLRQESVAFTPSEERELLATIEDYSDRLEGLVDNLLDMSRLSSDTLTPLLLPVEWSSVLPEALRGVPRGRVRVQLPPDLPAVEADPGMLERVIANVVENAVKYAPESEILISGSAAGRVTVGGRPAGELRIVDHGRGVPAEDVVAMFRPFQRLDDISQRPDGGTGVGLGLAVAKGFTEAMGGTLEAERTPGGGLTMVIRLPVSTATPGPTGPAGSVRSGRTGEP